MRRALVLALAACAHASPPPPSEAGLAPRPFTIEQIRAAMPEGTDLRMRVEEQGKPPAVLHWRVTRSDDSGLTVSAELLDNEGHLVANQGEKSSSWPEILGHASFPAAATKRHEGEIMVPAGTFHSIDYQVAGEGGVTTIYRFAKELPGPPVLMVVEKDGLVVRTMTLLSRK
jgi:hypothetical protein